MTNIKIKPLPLDERMKLVPLEKRVDESYKIINVPYDELKKVICKRGYETTFVASVGNDITEEEIKQIRVWVGYNHIDGDTDTWLYISVNELMDIIYVDSKEGNHLFDVQWIEEKLTEWFNGKEVD